MHNGDWCGPGFVEMDYWTLVLLSSRRAARQEGVIHRGSVAGSNFWSTVAAGFVRLLLILGSASRCSTRDVARTAPTVASDRASDFRAG